MSAPDSCNKTPEPGQPLQRMFDSVPPRYDMLNRLLTLRFDEYWRGLAARECLERAPGQVLDLCCGTGDLTLQLVRRAEDDVEIHGLDYSPAMLELARHKADRTGVSARIDFVEGNASAMPYPDNHFDSVGTAFAFRNVTWRNHLRDKVLAEVLRVLKPGGRFVIVETSQPGNALLRWCGHTWLKLIVAPVGTLVSGHPSAYRYLAESATNYYTAKEVAELLNGAGFKDVAATPLLGGVAAIHVGVKVSSEEV